MNDESLQIFLDCAKDIELDAGSSSVKWFVTTDSQVLLDKLYAEYGDKIIRVNGTIGHVYESYHLGIERVYEKTILDNELLSLCNEIVITGGEWI